MTDNNRAPEYTLESVRDYIVRQADIHAIMREVEARCLRNFLKHGAQVIPDGTSAKWIGPAITEVSEIRTAFKEGRGNWAESLMLHVVHAYATESLPQLRWALIKLMSRAAEWVADIDRRLLESRRVQVPGPTQADETMIQNLPIAPNTEIIPVIPGDDQR